MKQKHAFTLVELIVGIALFLILAISIWNGYNYVSESIRVLKIKNIALALANEQIEIVRNLPYAEVGVEGSIPDGILPRNQTAARGGLNFNIQFTVRNIDDPFDGTIGGTPNDLSPADYKLVEVEISCASCRGFQPLTVTTTAAPKNLETASTNGALFIRALDANGQPIEGASVHIVNNQVAPPITIDDTTDKNGWLQIVDVPPALESYEITVTKDGYSVNKTYPPGAPSNPNPVKPHVTVIVQQVTQISFSIDKVSTLNVSSLTKFCAPRGNINFSMQGAKKIGTNPDVYKYDETQNTGGDGTLTIPNLEWDSYSVTLNSSAYDLAGSTPLLPFNLGPNTTQNFILAVRPKAPDALLVTVKDAATQLPLSEAEVTLSKTGYSNALLTGVGYISQTDWRGGPGQDNFDDEIKYFSQDGNIETGNPSGELRLLKIDDQYQPSGWLISSTFDTGAASNYYNLIWYPQDQQPGVEIKFQIATANTAYPGTWNFLGPDGTADTYYTLAQTNINPIHNGDRYLRYKVFLSTTDPTVTPNVSDVAVTYTSICVPAGQAFFSGLNGGTYTLNITRTGYQTYNDSLNLNQDWQEKTITLTPE